MEKNMKAVRLESEFVFKSKLFFQFFFIKTGQNYSAYNTPLQYPVTV